MTSLDLPCPRCKRRPLVAQGRHVQCPCGWQVDSVNYLRWLANRILSSIDIWKRQSQKRCLDSLAMNPSKAPSLAEGFDAQGEAGLLMHWLKQFDLVRSRVAADFTSEQREIAIAVPFGGEKVFDAIFVSLLVALNCEGDQPTTVLWKTIGDAMPEWDVAEMRHRVEATMRRDARGEYQAGVGDLESDEARRERERGLNERNAECYRLSKKNQLTAKKIATYLNASRKKNPHWPESGEDARTINRYCKEHCKANGIVWEPRSPGRRAAKTS